MTTATTYDGITSIRITLLFANNYKSEIKYRRRALWRREEIITVAGLYRLQPWGQGNTLQRACTCYCCFSPGYLPAYCVGNKGRRDNSNLELAVVLLCWKSWQQQQQNWKANILEKSELQRSEPYSANFPKGICWLLSRRCSNETEKPAESNCYKAKNLGRKQESHCAEDCQGGR